MKKTGVRRDRDRGQAGLCNIRSSHIYGGAPWVADNADKQKLKDFLASNSPYANSFLSEKTVYLDVP